MEKEKNKSRLTLRLKNRMLHRRASRLPSMGLQINSNGNEILRKFSAPKLLANDTNLNNFENTGGVNTINERDEESDEEERRSIINNDSTPDERRHSRRLSMSRRLSEQLNINTAIIVDERQNIDGEDTANDKSNLANILSNIRKLKDDDSSIEDLDAILNSPVKPPNTPDNPNISDSEKHSTKVKKKKKQKVKRKNGKKEDQNVNLNVSDDVDHQDGDDSTNILEHNKSKLKKSRIKIKKKKKKIKKERSTIEMNNVDSLTPNGVDTVKITPINQIQSDHNITVTNFNDDSCDDDSIDVDDYIL